MRILVINGSPRRERSNSLCLTKAFIEGIKTSIGEKELGVEVKQFNVADLEIRPCKGCFSCWRKTPGKCCIEDDMVKVIEGQLWADIIIWSFPLYYFNVPGPLKILIDRQLPMFLPFMVDREDGVGSGNHPPRYDMSGKRHVLISTCGFYSAELNYDSVTAMFDRMLGKNNFETVFCGQGELFRVRQLSARTGEYLKVVENAGREFVEERITDGTRRKLEELLLPKEVFEAMADASWGIDKETGLKISNK